jgi:hypothetical protein
MAMGISDDELDATSRDLLKNIDDLRQLEQEKRRTARSSEEFHDLADRVDTVARDVFKAAHVQQREGAEDSRIAAEQAEQKPGDWTDRE